jgi:hypothetical protein
MMILGGHRVDRLYHHGDLRPALIARGRRCRFRTNLRAPFLERLSVSFRLDHADALRYFAAGAARQLPPLTAVPLLTEAHLL